MSYDPGAPGGPPPGQGWSGGQQPPPFPSGGGYGQQQPPPPGWGGPPAGGAPPAQQSNNFFGALFDFNFDNFATPVVIKILYILGMVLIGLAWIGYTIVSFASFGAGVGLAVLIGGAIVGLLYLIFFRMTLEFYYAVIRMSEDIHNRR